MIVYAVLSETSVRSLYIAALLPGLALAVLFSLMILVVCLLRPSLGGREEGAPLSEVLRGLPHLLPPLGLFLIVVGSIYFGVATPSEAAALGLMATLGLAAMKRRLSWQVVRQACENSMRITAMVMLIVTAAFFLTFVLSSTGVTTLITDAMVALNLSPVGTMLLIVAIYLMLGCFMETLTLMVATTPIVVPVIVTLGYDPVWFGVVFMILIECALITPPIGVNLFVVQSICPRAPFAEIARGALPFLCAMLLMIFALIAWPDIALWAVRILG
jgi:tripartite ATP-independent transporter DctM subunit